MPLLAALAAAGCASPPATTQHACCLPSTPAPIARAVGGTVLTEGLEWCDDNDQRVELANLTGQPVVMAFFFTSCDIVCPITVQRLQWVEASLPHNDRARVRFVLISIDPDHDTPSKLAAYRRTHHLSADRWTLLRADQATTARLAAKLGVAYHLDPVGGVRHSNQISVLDQAGSLAAQQIGIQEGTETLTATLRALLQKSDTNTAALTRLDNFRGDRTR